MSHQYPNSLVERLKACNTKKLIMSLRKRNLSTDYKLIGDIITSREETLEAQLDALKAKNAALQMQLDMSNTECLSFEIENNILKEKVVDLSSGVKNLGQRLNDMVEKCKKMASCSSNNEIIEISDDDDDNDNDNDEDVTVNSKSVSMDYELEEGEIPPSEQCDDQEGRG